MSLTPKQVRNGIPGPGAEGGNVAESGPKPAIPQGAAESKGEAHQSSGKAAFDGASPGSPGYAVSEWNSGVAEA